MDVSINCEENLFWLLFLEDFLGNQTEKNELETKKSEKGRDNKVTAPSPLVGEDAAQPIPFLSRTRNHSF